MGGEGELIEPGALVLAPGRVCAGTQPEPLRDRHLVLRPAPDRDADAGGGELLRVPLEGERQAEDRDVDGPLLGAGADVRVRRQREADVEAPAPPGAHLVEEEVDVGRHRVGHAARQHRLEVAPRELVLPLEEERARQLQPHPHQVGTLDQHDVEGGDGLVQQHLPFLVRAVGPLRGLQRREAVEEERVRLDRLLLEQRPERDDRLLEAAGAHQRPGGGLGSSGLGRVGRWRRVVGAGRGRGHRRLLALRLRVLRRRREREGERERGEEEAAPQIGKRHCGTTDRMREVGKRGAARGPPRVSPGCPGSSVASRPWSRRTRRQPT